MIRAMFRLLGLGLLALFAAAPAAGDWLVLRDGTRLETEGPWKVKGRQVVFTRPGGALAALRLADVDLDASAQATEAAAQAAAQPAVAAPPPPARPSRRPSVLSLTDDDLRPGGAGARAPVDEGTDDEAEADDGSEDDGSEDDGSGGDPPTAGAGETVTIVSWREQESSEIDGLEILGTVRNTSGDVAADIRVRVKVTDEEGNVQAEARAFLTRPSLGPGRTTTFRALLPGIYSLLEEPIFEVTSEGFTLSLVDEAEASEDDEYAYQEDDFAESADDLDALGDDLAEPGDDLEPLDDFDDEELDDEELDDEDGGGSGS